MMKEVVSKLGQLKHLLSEGGDTCYLDNLQKALDGDDETIWEFLCANELWGGAGSVADQALLNNNSLRNKLEKLLIEIGAFQQKAGRMNVRTEMWVSAFRQRQK